MKRRKGEADLQAQVRMLSLHYRLLNGERAFLDLLPRVERVSPPNTFQVCCLFLRYVVRVSFKKPPETIVLADDIDRSELASAEL